MGRSVAQRLYAGLLAAEEAPIRKQHWLEAGKDVPKNPELDTEIAAHCRESVDGILDQISEIEDGQAVRLVVKIRRNIKESRRKTG